MTSTKVQTGALVLALVFFGLGFFVRDLTLPEVSKVEGLSDLVNSKEDVVSFEPFWKAWNLLNEKYVDPDGITAEERLWGAISGLTASFEDPYTVFLPPEEKAMFDEDISGNFEGVGMEIGIRDETLTVIAPLKSTPAEAAGILSGDKIIEIDGETTLNMTIDQAVKIIRGERGTAVVLTVAREGREEPLEISITRDVINVPTVNTTLRDDGIFVLELYNFNSPSTDLFRGALQEFIDSSSNKLILDLRNNPGGYLNAAIDVSSWFLPAGKVVVMEDFGRNEGNKQHRSKGYDVFNENLEMVILVNEGTASASEIVAGALSEHGVATLVGTTTFGKGSVQELMPVTKDTSIKITVARWLTPEGNQISEGGLVPDVEVPMTLEDLEAARDPQLNRAVEMLLQ
jgi:carboxyl-terminal processing protease